MLHFKSTSFFRDKSLRPVLYSGLITTIFITATLGLFRPHAQNSKNIIQVSITYPDQPENHAFWVNLFWIRPI
ncbi:MAG: hypothetical protein CVU00_13175 [Bacteroidetes bacterium HGW-Bacteroidetes-17]|nr:MAG: hypothetical protein CVU00_13175 [Bacteroidetes bacterium HGW-Bacteroidetes-17]